MKKPIFSLIFFCFAMVQMHSQTGTTVNFDYDDAGNCIVKYKTIVIYSPPAPSDDNDGQQSDSISAADGLTQAPVQIEDFVGGIEILIYPNPTRGILYIEIQNNHKQTPVTYVLTQSNGRHLLGGTSTNNPLVLNLSSFSSGVYLLRLSINEKTETYKIIKQ
ncbi:MAG: T9SS type A sorting domain-containing protein [Paludibacter sp.]|nr:T9SS type A sorting domain-containing protein [Paludibacter sp.]